MARLVGRHFEEHERRIRPGRGNVPFHASVGKKKGPRVKFEFLASKRVKLFVFFTSQLMLSNISMHKRVFLSVRPFGSSQRSKRHLGWEFEVLEVVEWRLVRFYPGLWELWSVWSHGPQGDGGSREGAQLYHNFRVQHSGCFKSLNSRCLRSFWLRWSSRMANRHQEWSDSS